MSAIWESANWTRQFGMLPSTHLSIAMNILTCLCCPVADHVKTGIGYISLLANIRISSFSVEQRDNRVMCIEQNHTYFPGTSKSF